MNPDPEIIARFTTLSDGREGIRGAIQIKASQPEQAGPAACLDFVSSDETLDRYNEIILASGWQIGNYQRNPIFQNAHQYGDIIFTLGKAIITEVRGSQLFQRIQFATEANPVAKIAYGLYRGGFLNAVSVGFVPVRWENGTEKTSYRRKYLQQELLEVSAVGIPANPNALALGYKSGAVARTDLREAYELLRATLGEVPPSLSPELIQLAARLYQTLRKI
jgi:Escherichia/Staphylococcus phage prohead protease